MGATEAEAATPATPSLLATPADFLAFGSNEELVQTRQIWNPSQVLTLMRRASVGIESRCQRRLAPFTTLFESQTALGMSPEEYGEQGDMAMDLTGALGWSQAASMGVSDMVREFWLQEYAPKYPELWTVTLNKVELARTFGDTQTFGAESFTTWQGPEADTGHVKMPIGTYCPQGTTIRAWYSGGYTGGVPWDLNQACVLHAMKLCLLGIEPETRPGASLAELDEEVLLLIADYVR